MRYFLSTTTQNKAEGGYNEYGKMETKGTGDVAKTNAIAELHTTYASMLKSSGLQYWSGKVLDMKQNVIDKLECGEYVDVTE